MHALQHALEDIMSRLHVHSNLHSPHLQESKASPSIAPSWERQFCKAIAWNVIGLANHGILLCKTGQPISVYAVSALTQRLALHILRCHVGSSTREP